MTAGMQFIVNQREQDLCDARVDISEIRDLIAKIQSYPMNEKVSMAWNMANDCVAKYHRPDHKAQQELGKESKVS